MKTNFRAARKALKLTQEDVAKALQVDRTTYVRYESGQRECSFETLLKLADYLNVSTDYLLGRHSLDNKKIVQNNKNGNNYFGVTGGNFNSTVTIG